MIFARYWLRLEWRRRWLPLLSIALLVALASGVTLGAVAGARRGASAIDRLGEITRPADAVVVPNRPGFDWAAVRALPEVAALTTFPGYTSLTVVEAPDDEFTSFIPADANAMDTVERPVVLHGRRADPGRADEAVVTAEFVDTFHHGLGDTVTLQLMTPQEADTNAQTGSVRPSGPRVRVRIVGVVRSPWYSDHPGARGSLIPSPGVVARYRANLLGAKGSVPTSGLVRLHGGAASLAAFRAHLAQMSPNVDIVDRADSVDRARKTVKFESGCLLAVGIIALLASIIVLGQMISRHTAAETVAMRTLGAVGMTRRQSTWLAAIGPGAAAALGSVVGIGSAYVASCWMPFGTAADWEPHPGLDADWLVLVTGAAAIVLYVACAARATTWLRLAFDGPVRSIPGSVVARVMARAGLPVPVVIGTRFALESGQTTRSVAVRPALIGSVVGVMGIVTAFTFSAAVADAESHPERFGQNYHLLVVLGCCDQNFLPPQKVLAALSNEPDVLGITDMRTAVATSGRVSVLARSYDPIGTPLPLVMTDGTEPRSGDVVLAPATARQLHAHVGSNVALSGDGAEQSLRVSGIGFGVQTSTTSYDSGAWVSPTAFEHLFRGFQEHAGMIALRPGVRPAVALRRIQQVAAGVAGQRQQDVIVVPPFVPDQVAQIHDLRALPTALGYLLILLAIGGVAQAFAAAVRTRTHQIAVLRVLGMTSRQSRTLVWTQATVFAVIALLGGIPLGIALGRTLWRVTADIMPLQYQPPLPSPALLLIGPVVFGSVFLLAAPQARRAARLRIADALRTE